MFLNTFFIKIHKLQSIKETSAYIITPPITWPLNSSALTFTVSSIRHSEEKCNCEFLTPRDNYYYNSNLKKIILCSDFLLLSKKELFISQLALCFIVKMLPELPRSLEACGIFLYMIFNTQLSKYTFNSMKWRNLVASTKTCVFHNKLLLFPKTFQNVALLDVIYSCGVLEATLWISYRWGYWVPPWMAGVLPTHCPIHSGLHYEKKNNWTPTQHIVEVFFLRPWRFRRVKIISAMKAITVQWEKVMTTAW